MGLSRLKIVILVLIFWSIIPSIYSPFETPQIIAQGDLSPLYTVEVPNGSIWGFKWSHDGSRLAVWSFDTVEIYDGENGDGILSFNHNASVQGLGFSLEDSLLYSWSDDATVRVTDIISGEIIRELEHPSKVFRATWSPDEHYLITSGEFDYPYLWDFEQGERIEWWTLEDQVFSAQWRDDGQQILTISSDEVATIWDFQTGDIVKRIESPDDLRSAQWNSDYSRLLTWGHDGLARVWDIATGDIILELFGREGECCFGATSWAAEDNIIIVENEFGNQVRNASDGSFLIAPADRYYLSHDRNNGIAFEENTILKWDLVSGDETRLNHDSVVRNAFIKYDDSQIVTWTIDNQAYVWDIETGTMIFSVLHDTERSLDGANFPPDGNRLMTFSQNGLIKVWMIPDQNEE